MVSTLVGWLAFLEAQATVFAALTGLVFVALSINLKDILRLPGVPGRAGEALILLVQPVLIGLMGLAPFTLRRFGAVVLAVSVAGWAAVTSILVVGRRALRERSALTRVGRVTTVQLATLLVVTAGALLVSGDASGLWWQAAGALTSLVVGVATAWILLVEILR